MREYCGYIHFVCFEAHALAKKQFSFKLVFITQLNYRSGIPNTPPAGACGLEGHFMWPEMRLGNFCIIKI